MESLDKSYESMRSDEHDPLHYKIDSEGEPPTDQVGDKITVIKKGQVIKEILEVGEGLGKPGRPYTVFVTYEGFFAKREEVFSRQEEVQEVSLGDKNCVLPYGLWRAIEHMRRNEKSVVMIKPKWGFNYQKEGEEQPICWPPGWDTEEKKAILKKRRIFYEVKLHDWIVKHDVFGDGMIIKTVLDRGVGYDRPFDFDEIAIDLKIHQTNQDQVQVVYQELSEFATTMDNDEVIFNTVKKLLQTMKTKEQVQCLVNPAYLQQNDHRFLAKYGIDCGHPVNIDLHMKHLVRVDDLYKDRSTFVKTLKDGQGSANPFPDTEVYCKSCAKLYLVKVRVCVDGVEKYCTREFEELEVWEEEKDVLKYDMEEYMLPAVVRRVLKRTKLKEIVEIRTNRTDKLFDNFEDPVFNRSLFGQDFQQAVITVGLVYFVQKPYIFQSTIAEKVDRFVFFKSIANKFYQAQNTRKAMRMYMRMNQYFRSKDAKNNFQKEDEDAIEFKEKTAQLELVLWRMTVQMNKQNLCNICVLHLKQADWANVVKYANDALEVDNKFPKALFLLARAQTETTEYEKALATLGYLLEVDPGNQDASKELARVQQLFKQYKQKEDAMCKKMFS